MYSEYVDIAEEFKNIFVGMGREKVDPIHIQKKDDARPIAQGKRPIPIQLRDAKVKKLKPMKDNDIIEGPLPPNQCKGWISNMVITKKTDSE